MAKKFFYNRVYNTKRTIINIIIIGVCIIGVIICFIITSNLDIEDQNKSGGELSLKSESTVEVNQSFTNELFFSKIENVSLDEIKVTYPEDYDISKIGRYEITLEISGKPYTTYLVVVDTVKPELEVKKVTIKENGRYSAKDFVESCTDNSNKECNIKFFSEGIDEDGNAIDYKSYKKAGIYPIKIVATDEAGNENIKETELIIEGSSTPTIDPTPVTCKYGNNIYDTSVYLLTVDITHSGCAVSLDLYKDKTTTINIDKVMESETTRIRKDIEALNLTGTLSLNRVKNAIINQSGDGIVGYELLMTVVLTQNGKSETIAEYKVDSAGKRVFITNKYNLKA